MELLSYFPEELRRSCSEIPFEPKHPTEVDIQTRRVIILTSLASDHHEEDSSYFLTVEQDCSLTRIAKKLVQLVNNNEDIDELHNELADLKTIF
jgi:hypothetical protein